MKFQKKYVVCSLLFLNILFPGVLGYAQEIEKPPECHVSFQKPYTCTLKDGFQPKTLEKFMEEYDYEKTAALARGNPSIFFGFTFLVCDENSHPKDFRVTPLLWALNVDDTKKSHYCVNCMVARMKDVDVFEAYVCLVEHMPTNTSYLTCRAVDMRRMLSWDSPPRFTPDMDRLPEIYRIDMEKDFYEQLHEYLKTLDFGPNRWDQTRCTSLRVYCPEADREKFKFPYIGDEQRLAYRSKYYSLLATYYDDPVDNAPESHLDNDGNALQPSKPEE